MATQGFSKDNRDYFDTSEPWSNPTDSIKAQLHRLIIENQSEDGSIDRSDQGAMADEILVIIQAARIEENESILSVAQHEIDLPDHCEMHDRFAAACHACKKRHWYGEISKDWKRIINIRLKELKALNNIGGKVDDSQ